MSEGWETGDAAECRDCVKMNITLYDISYLMQRKILCSKLLYKIMVNGLVDDRTEENV